MIKEIKVINLYKRCLLLMMTLFLFTGISSECNAKESEKNISSFFNGNGSSDSPFLLFNDSDLCKLSELVDEGQDMSGLYFALANDIQLGQDKWEPIGSYEQGYSFAGQLDGLGYGIYVGCCENKNAALFEVLDGTVKNISISGSFSGDENVAAIANYGKGNIYNCASNAIINARRNDTFASGVVNHWDGKIINVSYCGSISGTGEKNAIANQVTDNCIIENVYSNTDLEKYPGIVNKDEEINLDNVIESFNDYSAVLFKDYGVRGNMSWEKEKDCPRLTRDYADFEGTGTERNPYVIKSESDLQLLATLMNSGTDFSSSYFMQVDDIDIDAREWTPIADGDVGVDFFAGTYNGVGHRISFINNTDTVALFGKLGGLVLNVDLSVSKQQDNNALVVEMDGASGRIINSKISNCNDENGIIRGGIDAGFIKSLYMDKVSETSIEQLNNALESLVISEGIHCGELFVWEFKDSDICFGDNYKNIYLSEDFFSWIGYGTEANPYEIHSLSDVIQLREHVYYGTNYTCYCFKQMNDIDISEAMSHWKSISGSYADACFSGIYDGDGHVISSFFGVDATGKDCGSFFGMTNGILYNVVLEADENQGYENGLLAYSNGGKILNSICYYHNSDNRTPFLVRENHGLINNCWLINDNPVVSAALVSETTGEEKNVNQSVLNNLVSINISQLNDATVVCAYDSKRTISDLNSWRLVDNRILPEKNITRWSGVWLDFYKYVFKHSHVLWLSVLWLVVIVILYLYRFRKCKGIVIAHWTKQWSIELCILSFIWISFVFSLKRIIDIHLSMGMKSLTIGSIALFTVNMFYLLRNTHPSFNHEKIINTFKTHYVLLFGLLITIVVTVSQFGLEPYYDADLYYGDYIYGLQNYDGTILGLFGAFKNWGKGMLPIEMIWTVGEAFFIGTAKGVYVVNLFLLILAQVGTYQIIRKVFPNITNNYRGCLALIFALLPYVSVGVVYINSDFGVIIFWVLAVWCYFYNYNLLGMFFIYGLAGNKTNMVLLYTVFVLILLQVEFKRDKEKCMLTYPAFTRSFPLVMFCFVYFFVLLFDRHTTGGLRLKDYIVLSKNHVLTLLLQYFGYGFLWIIELAAVFVFIYIYRKRKAIEGDTYYIRAFIITSVIQLLVLNFIYTLALCPRYFAVTMLKDIILLAFVVGNIERKWLKRGIVIAVLGLLFIQQTHTIDPLILKTANKGRVGGWILSLGEMSMYAGDLATYNYNYAVTARDASIIVNRDLSNVYFEAGGVNTYELGIENSQIYPVYLDTYKTEKTYFRNGDTERINLQSLTYGSTLDKYELLDKSNVNLLLSNDERSWSISMLKDNGFSVDSIESYNGFAFVKLSKR